MSAYTVESNFTALSFIFFIFFLNNDDLLKTVSISTSLGKNSCKYYLYRKIFKHMHTMHTAMMHAQNVIISQMRHLMRTRKFLNTFSYIQWFLHRHRWDMSLQVLSNFSLTCDKKLKKLISFEHANDMKCLECPLVSISPFSSSMWLYATRPNMKYDVLWYTQLFSKTAQRKREI